MNRKKIIAVLIFVYIITFILACNLSFSNADFYKNRKQRGFLRSVDTSVEPDQPDSKNIEIADEDSIDKLFADAEKNKDMLFPSGNFDAWVFYMTDLDENNVGTYKFSKQGTWTENTHENCEEYSNGKAVGHGLKTINNVRYYRYKNRSDRWKNFSYAKFDPFTSDKDPDGKLKKREERFLFFRFTATAAMNTKLDNSMLCVDTYTKFCWYYSEPSWCKTLAGNKIPNDWVDFEDPNLSTANTAEHTKAYGKFYYYDPIGYVEANGDVVLYDWAKEDLKNAYFDPRQKYSTTAEREASKPGKSPYYDINAKAQDETPSASDIHIPEHESGLLVQLSYIENKSLASIVQVYKDRLNYAYFDVTTSSDFSKKERLSFKKQRVEISGNAKITNRNFLLKLLKETTFTINTQLCFSNEAKVFGGMPSLIVNEIMPDNYAYLTFSFVPASGSEDAYVRFDGLENAVYNSRIGARKVEASCSTQLGQKIKLNKPFNIAVDYKINGTYDTNKIENAEVSVLYTFDFK